MRIIAALFAVLAITVWWGPLPAFAQSPLLVLLAIMCLAFRRAVFLPKNATESKARDLAAAAPADPQSRSES